MQRFYKPEVGCLIALFLFALGLRLTGLDYGYFHGDERVNDAAKVLAGQLVPGQHFYPPFINYLNAVALLGLFPIGMLAGWWDGAGAFRAAYFADPTPFYMAARGMTALWGAALAPLFFMIARQFQLNRLHAVVLGLMGALFPLSVFMAHIAKGDAALASMTVACIWALVARLGARGQSHAMRWDLLLGLVVALTLSFKHSAVFMLLPLGIGWLMLLWMQEGGAGALRAFGRVLGCALILWPVMNIGLILDFEGFLAYQQIQSVMSLRDGGWAGITTLFWRAREGAFGLSGGFALVALFSPLLLLVLPMVPQRRILAMIWGAVTLATLFTAWLAGPRQPEHLWIANFAVYLLIAGIILLNVLQNATGGLKLVAAVWLSGSGALLSMDCADVLRQALAAPNTDPLNTLLAESYADRRILSAVALAQPQSAAAQADEQARLERLALKYRVDLPAQAAERHAGGDLDSALYYLRMPQVMFGLEGVEEGAESYQVQAHAWPLQPEEWQHDHWRQRGIDLFVVADFDHHANHAPPAMRQAFLQQLARDCTEAARFAAGKPLFLERELRLYDCAE